MELLETLFTSVSGSTIFSYFLIFSIFHFFVFFFKNRLFGSDLAL